MPVASSAFPLAARAQDEEDRVHRVPVGDAGVVTAERMRRPGREQALHLRPELVRDPPAVVLRDQAHSFPPTSACSTRWGFVVS
jgi:hypothetical protein